MQHINMRILIGFSCLADIYFFLSESSDIAILNCLKIAYTRNNLHASARLGHPLRKGNELTQNNGSQQQFLQMDTNKAIT